MLAGEGGTKIKCWILIWTQIPYSNPQNLAETSENLYRYQTLVRYTIFLFFQKGKCTPCRKTLKVYRKCRQRDFHDGKHIFNIQFIDSWECWGPTIYSYSRYSYRYKIIIKVIKIIKNNYNLNLYRISMNRLKIFLFSS